MDLPLAVGDVYMNDLRSIFVRVIGLLDRSHPLLEIFRHNRWVPLYDSGMFCQDWENISILFLYNPYQILTSVGWSEPSPANILEIQRKRLKIFDYDNRVLYRYTEPGLPDELSSTV